MNKAAGAPRILTIDGCPLNCTRHTLELAGFKEFDHLELHRLGWRKHACPVTPERIAQGVMAAKELLSQPVPALPPDPSPNLRGGLSGSILPVAKEPLKV